MKLKSEFLGEEDVHKLMLSLGAFAVIAMLATGAQSVLTTLIVSHGIDIYAVSAIGVLFPLATVYFGFSQLISIGAASYISRQLGEGKKGEILATTIAAYLMTILISIGLMGVTWLFKDFILEFLGAQDKVLEFARRYLSAFIFSIPFTAMVLLSSAIFRSYGKMKLSMLVILIEATLIVALDYVTIYWLNLGIAWIGWTVAIAGFLTTLIGIFLLVRVILFPARINSETKSAWHFKTLFKFDLLSVKGILLIGISALGRSLAGAIFSLVLNRTVTAIGGEDALAAVGTVNRAALFLIFAVMGVNQAMQPIVSFNFTAGKGERVKKALRYAVIYATVIGVIGSLLGLFFPSQIAEVFTKDKEVIDDVAQVFRMQMILFVSIGVQTLAATYYQAIGRARMSFFLSVFKPLVILMPLVYFLPRMLDSGVLAIWWAFPVADVAFTLICVFVLISGVKKLECSKMEAV